MLAMQPISADSAVLADLYLDPYIRRVGHDHRPAAPIHHAAAQYVAALVDGRFVGAFLAIKSSRIDWDVHALLRRAALAHSRALGALFIAWCFAHAAVQRLTALVIEGLEAAANYCRRLGFVDEGCRRAGAQVGGALRGVRMLGLTRADWEAAR